MLDSSAPAMPLISHPSSSHGILSEAIQCKTKHNGVNSFADTIDSARTKEFFLCLRPSSLNSLKLKASWSSIGTEVGRKKRHQVTVGASPPTEDAVISTEPLTKQDLVDYLASGCKPKEKWRIGTEHEKFGFEFGTLSPMKYGQIAELLNNISERFDWDKIMEGENIIGLKQGKQIISLEPGGQFELSGAPLETLHQTCAEVNSHLYQKPTKVSLIKENCHRNKYGSAFGFTSLAQAHSSLGMNSYAHTCKT